MAMRNGVEGYFELRYTRFVKVSKRDLGEVGLETKHGKRRLEAQDEDEAKIEAARILVEMEAPVINHHAFKPIGLIFFIPYEQRVFFFQEYGEDTPERLLERVEK